jgi:hypothetical protein
MIASSLLLAAANPPTGGGRVTRYERAPGGNLVARITVEYRSVSGAPVSVAAPVERESADAVEQQLHEQCEQRREAASRR